MKQTLALLTGLLLMAVGIANGIAATIAGPQMTAGGKAVNLGGLEWLDWNNAETEELSVLAVEAKMGVGGPLEGWRYATQSEFENLFDSLWGGTNEGWHDSNLDGARWVYDTFMANDDNLSWSIAFGRADAAPGSVLHGHYHHLGRTRACLFSHPRALPLAPCPPRPRSCACA